MTTDCALQPALLKLIDIVAEENSVLARDEIVNHGGFTDRKNQALREVMAAQRFEERSTRFAECRPLLQRLSDELRTNTRLLKLHIAAVGEVSDIIIGSLREADSDGTYSRGFSPARR